MCFRRTNVGPERGGGNLHRTLAVGGEQLLQGWCRVARVLEELRAVMPELPHRLLQQRSPQGLPLLVSMLIYSSFDRELNYRA